MEGYNCNVVQNVLIRYHKELFPELEEVKVFEQGDFLDLRAAETVEIKKGEFKMVSLGVSIKLPKGYWGQVVPRSSTFKNFGVIMANSFGVIDECYCGDNDIWQFPAYAVRDTVIHVNDRICQIRIVKKHPFILKTVDKLEETGRGGFGSTGIQ